MFFGTWYSYDIYPKSEYVLSILTSEVKIILIILEGIFISFFDFSLLNLIMTLEHIPMHNSKKFVVIFIFGFCFVNFLIRIYLGELILTLVAILGALLKYFLYCYFFSHFFTWTYNSLLDSPFPISLFFWKSKSQIGYFYFIFGFIFLCFHFLINFLIFLLHFILLLIFI